MKHLMKRLKDKVSSAELYKMNYKSTPIEYEMNRLKTISTEESEGWALRVIINGKVGFSSATSESQFDAMAEKAIEIAQFGQPAIFDFPKQLDRKLEDTIKLYDPSIPVKSTAQMIEEGNSIVAKVKSFNPDLRCDVDFTNLE